MTADPTLAYHVTTRNKLERYRKSRIILPPVRFWPNRITAERWARRTGRDTIIAFTRPEPAYPLPDHKPALWSPSIVRDWRVVWQR